MRDLKRILELRFENHSQREIARMLKVSRNTVRDVFDAADAAGVYWNIAYNLSESKINELLFPSNGIDVSYEQPDYAYVHKVSIPLSEVHAICYRSPHNPLKKSIFFKS